jgi:hypothetical protein
MRIRQMEVQGVQQLDRGVRGVHRHVARHVEQRFRVVEDDADAGVDEVVGHLLRRAGRHCEHTDDDVLLADDVLQLALVLDRRAADLMPDPRLVGVEDRRDVDPVLGEDRRAGDRLTEAAGTDKRDVVLALRPEDPADLAEQRVDRVTDAALPELPEVGQVAADLGRVDVRVVGDLLGGDAVLTHLLRLRQDLQVARETGCDTDCQAVGRASVRLCLQHHEALCPKARMQPCGCHLPGSS